MLRTAAAWAFLTVLALGAWAAERAAGGAAATSPDDAAAYGGLLPALAKIQEKELGDLHQARTAREKIEDAGVKLGRWYRIGPFRDQPPLLNWMENVESSFSHRYEVEEDLDEDGDVRRLAKTYRAANFPTTPDAQRKWTAHADWIDGYLPVQIIC